MNIIIIMTTITTIPLSTDLRDKIKSFGRKGESYEDILNRMYESYSNSYIEDILMSRENTLTLNEARQFIEKDD